MSRALASAAARAYLQAMENRSVAAPRPLLAAIVALILIALLLASGGQGLDGLPALAFALCLAVAGFEPRLPAFLRFRLGAAVRRSATSPPSSSFA
jgi:hypothetical protein